MTDSTASAARLLRGGTVLTSDPEVPDLLRGDLLIRDGRVAAVGEDLTVGSDVEIVDISGRIVFRAWSTPTSTSGRGRFYSNTRRWGSARTSMSSSPSGLLK